MKKYFKYISAIALLAMIGFSFSSCKEDDLGETIFPDVSEELDPSSYTYKFDKWLKENYLDVYNLDFQYKLKDTETNMNYNLEPASLDNAIDLAVLTKYLWFDAYESVTGSKEFVKAYGPRILMLIGSPAYNPTTRTMILGLAEGGIKVSLFRVNSMNINSFEQLNEYYFKTMHHEFSHILHQTKSIPREFQLLSLGHYDATNWQDRNEGVVHSLGFVTTYGSSQIREDFAEIIANYITKTDAEWERIWKEAGRGYATDGDEDSESLSNLTYYSFFYYANNDAAAGITYANEWSVEEKEDGTLVLRNQYMRGTGKVTKQSDGKYLDEDGNECDSAGYRLDKDGKRIPIYVYPVEDTDGVDGVALLEQKINIARVWFQEQWGINLDELRQEVQKRQQSYDINALRQQVYGIQ